jgi:hypothetical protein
MASRSWTKLGSCAEPGGGLPHLERDLGIAGGAALLSESMVSGLVVTATDGTVAETDRDSTVMDASHSEAVGS